MDPAALDRLLAAVLDPAAARPSSRLRPLVVGWPVGRDRRAAPLHSLPRAQAIFDHLRLPDFSFTDKTIVL